MLRNVSGGGNSSIFLSLGRGLIEMLRGIQVAKQLGSEAAKRNFFSLQGRESNCSSATSYSCERGVQKTKNSDRATECAMTDIAKNDKNTIKQKQPSYLAASSPAASSDTNHSPLTTHHSLKRKVAFTLAEVLITLGIIGVVAALTLPVLVASYQEKVTVTKLKKMYQAVMEAELASSIENGSPADWTEIDSSSITLRKYFEKYYLPYIKVPYKITKIKNVGTTPGVYLESRNGFLKNLNGGRIWGTVTDDNIVNFADGSCFFFAENAQYKILVYDVNCEKAPNVYGKDIWNMFEFRWFFKVEKNWQNCKHGCHRAQVPFITSSTVKDSEFEQYCRASTCAVCGAPNECFSFLFHDGMEFNHDKRNWKSK